MTRLPAPDAPAQAEVIALPRGLLERLIAPEIDAGHNPEDFITCRLCESIWTDPPVPHWKTKELQVEHHESYCPAPEVQRLLAQQPAPAPATTDERLEVVSAAVHDDWMASKLAQGVTSRCGQDGEEYMVPYAQLSEAAKELDRVTVRAVLKHVLPAEALAAENQRLRAALREMLTTFSAVTSRHEADVTHRARIALNAELPGT